MQAVQALPAWLGCQTGERLQQSLHYSPVITGIAFLPMIAVSANLSNITLLPRLGPRPPVTAGMLLAAGGMVWLTGIGPHSAYTAAVLGPLLVTGLGLGLTIAPAMNTGTFGVAPQDVGVASAVLNTGQQTGGSIGTSLLNTLAASATASYLASRLSPGTLVHGRPGPQLVTLSLVHRYTTAFWWAAAIFAGGAVICGTSLRWGPLGPPRGPHRARAAGQHHPGGHWRAAGDLIAARRTGDVGRYGERTSPLAATPSRCPRRPAGSTAGLTAMLVALGVMSILWRA